MADINYTASTPKKQYTRRIGENGFLGADFSTAPIFASPRRFRDLKNVWKDYKSGSGVAIETVPGYRAIENYISETVGVTSKIHGIFRFDTTKSSADTTPSYRLNKDSSGVWYIVHYGNKLACFSEMSFFASLDMRVDMGFVTLPDKDSLAIQNGNNLVIICDGKIFSVFPCELEFDFHAYPSMWFAFEVVQLNQDEAFDVSHPHAQYCPTTYINGLPYEQKNMLAVRSKEKYTGVSTSSEQRNDGNTTTTVYYVSVTLHEKVPEGSSPYKSNIKSVTLDGNSVNLTNVMVTRNQGYIATIRIDTSDYTSGQTHTVEVEYQSDATKFTSYKSYEDYKDRNTFNEGNPGYSGTAYDAIAGCTICASYDDRIFLAGNPALPNTVFYSQRDLTGYNNPTYFGVLNYNNLGTSNAPITAMIPSANALYVLKDDSATDPTMYVLSGFSTEKDLIPRIYTVESGLPGIGCKGAACNFLDDIVFMSRNGVIGIDKQAVNLERTLGDRSALINGKLLLEDVTQAVFAEAEGYLWCLFKNNGHVYLADSRAYTQGAGYEWYYIDSVGSWSNDADGYEYSNEYLQIHGDTVYDFHDASGFKYASVSDLERDFFNSQYDRNNYIIKYKADGSVLALPKSGVTAYTIVTCENEHELYTGGAQTTVYLDYTETEGDYNSNHERYAMTYAKDTSGAYVVLVPTGNTEGGVPTYYQVKPTGEKVCTNSTVFHPATCMVAANDRIFFGTDNGDLLTFNNDKRGVQAESEIAVRAEDNHNDDTDIYEQNRYPFLLRPEWYSFCGHRIESFVETSDDDGGIGNLTKDTVRRSCVVDMKAMLGSKYKITTYTDRDGWKNDNAATGSMNDASQTMLDAVNFSGDEHINVQIRERARKWVHKRYRVESNGFRAPFGLYRITYNFEINGRIK